MAGGRNFPVAVREKQSMTAIVSNITGILYGAAAGLMFAVGCGSSAAATRAAKVLIERVNVLPMTSSGAELRDVSVLISDGRIDSIEAARDQRRFAGERIDGAGRWLMPALADMHVHLENHRLLRIWLNDPTIPADAVDLADLVAPYVANGVLQVANMSAMSESIGQRLDIESGRVLGPHIALGAMIDGAPPDWPAGMTRVAATASDGRQAVRDAKAEGYDFIKVYNRLDLPTFHAVVDEARQQRLNVAGHLIARGQGLTESLLRPGFGMVAHLQEYSHQSVKLDDAQIRRFAQMTKRNGTWVVTTLNADQRIADVLRDSGALSKWQQHQYMHPLTYRYWTDRNSLLADRSPARLARFERIVADDVRLLRAFIDADVPIVAGTDFPLPLQAPGFALHDELRAMVAAGMSAEQALLSATRLPATWLGVSQDRGTVEVGKRADLLLLAADPRADITNTRRIVAVFVSGRYLSEPALKRMLNTTAQRYGRDRAMAEHRAVIARYPLLGCMN